MLIMLEGPQPCTIFCLPKMFLFIKTRVDTCNVLCTVKDQLSSSPLTIMQYRYYRCKLSLRRGSLSPESIILLLHNREGQNWTRSRLRKWTKHHDNKDELCWTQQSFSSIIYEVPHLIVSVLGGLVSHDKLFNRSSAVLSAVVTPFDMAMLWILLLSLDAKLKHKPGIRQNVDDGNTIKLAVTGTNVSTVVQFWLSLCCISYTPVVLCCRKRARSGSVECTRE